MRKTIKIECELTFDIKITDVVVDIDLESLKFKLFRMQKGVHYLLSMNEGKIGQYNGTQERCLKYALDDIIEYVHKKMSYLGVEAKS